MEMTNLDKYPTPWTVCPDDENRRVAIRDANGGEVVYITDVLRGRAIEDARMLADMASEVKALRAQVAAVPDGGERLVKVSDLNDLVLVLQALKRNAEGQITSFELLKENARLRADAVDGAMKRLQFLIDSAMLLFPAEKVDPSVLKEKK